MTPADQIGTLGDHSHVEGGIHFHNIQQIYRMSPPQPVDKVLLAEARQRLEEMPVDDIPEPSSLPPGSRIPFGLNPLFVGRGDDLQWLAKVLKEGKTAAVGQIAAATGLGGVGKTQLAVEFVHRYGQYFAGGVHWVSFADPAAIPSEIVACGLPGQGGLSLEQQLQLVLSAWQSPVPRLLVFDNCEEGELLAQWRPKTGGSRVLVTSRKGSWDDTAGIAARQIGVLSRVESIALLKKFRPTMNDNDAGAIAEELGDLPLALHLAGSFLKRYEVAPDDYLRQLLDRNLLDHPSLRGRGLKMSPTGHETHVGRTFALSYGRLAPKDRIDRLAISLLNRAACFAPGIPIPQALLLKTLRPADQNEALDHMDACNRLVDLGLLERNAEDALVLHRLLAHFVLTDAEDSEALEAVEHTLIEEARIINDSGTPGPLIEWQAHLRWVTDKTKKRLDKQAALLGHSLGFHLHTIGDYEGAKSYLERAVEVGEIAFGLNHPSTAAVINDLGYLLHSMGNYENSKRLLERALAICEKSLGSDSRDTANCLNNLGHLLHSMGDYDSARVYTKRALVMRERVLGTKHPDTAVSLNNLGGLLFSLGDDAGAKKYYERALAIRRNVLGPDHPHTATSINNLGGLLFSVDDYEGARPYCEQALEIYKKTLGPEHPTYATSLNNLGALLMQMGDLQDARPYYEQGLKIRDKVLGPEHPDTAASLNNLGRLLTLMGDYKGAKPLLERALAIWENVLGPNHPSTALALNNLGMLLSSCGNHEDARLLLQRALAIYSEAFGPERPETKKVLKNLHDLELSGT